LLTPFPRLNVEQSVFVYRLNNAPSIALAQRLGFTVEGRIRHHVWTNGAWRDSLLYSLLSDEWPSWADSAADSRLTA